MAPASATHASQPRYGSQAEACPNGSFPAVQQLAQSTPHSETINAAVTEEHSRKWYRMARSRPIARDQTATHDAKLAVLRVLSEAFEQAAKQFTSDAKNSIAKQIATKFLNFWNQSLAEFDEPPKPTYSSVLASGRKPQGQLAVTAPAPLQRKQQTATRLQGRPPVTPPKEDLRVFVRLDADAPARKHERYAIRTHVAARVGIDLRRVPAAFPVNTGWAIQASDKATRDMLVQRQLTDLRGIEINYDVAVREEIVCQTGLEPLSGQNILFHFQTALLSDIGF
ncbi:endonuclease/exonuclease/phosphatase [Hirsutella rhossiliensis]